MNFRLPTRYEQQTLAIKVETTQPTRVRLVVADADNTKHRVFTNRYKTVRGSETFYVRMPVSPSKALITVYDEGRGNVPQEQEPNLRVVDIERIPLHKKLDAVDVKNSQIRSFIRFAESISYYLPTMKANQMYESPDKKFFLNLKDGFYGKNGKRISTPARVNTKTGVIEIDKECMLAMTVPMRMAILLHEFSHFYLNDNIADETEADLNALLIYLGLGYPRIEAHQAFLETFNDSPSDGNANRYEIINQFIKDFDKNKTVLQ